MSRTRGEPIFAPFASNSGSFNEKEYAGLQKKETKMAQGRAY